MPDSKNLHYWDSNLRQAMRPQASVRTGSRLSGHVRPKTRFFGPDRDKVLPGVLVYPPGISSGHVLLSPMVLQY